MSLHALDAALPSPVTPRLLRRNEIAHLICLGHVLVLHRRTVYRLNPWLATHPGGALAILHFVGRDATDELEAYHPVTVINRMRAFAVGEVDDRDWSDVTGWRPLVPPVQLGWPDKSTAYAGVPSLAHSLAQLDAASSAPLSLHTPLTHTRQH